MFLLLFSTNILWISQCIIIILAANVDKTHILKPSEETESGHSDIPRHSPSIAEPSAKQSEHSRPSSTTLHETDPLKVRPESGFSEHGRPKSRESIQSRPKSGVSSGGLSFNSGVSQPDDISSLSKLSLPTAASEHSASSHGLKLAPLLRVIRVNLLQICQDSNRFKIPNGRD